MENKKSINKLSLLLNVVLIGIISCSITGCPPSTSPSEPLPSDCDRICTDYSRSDPFQLINTALLGTMARAYQAGRPRIDNSFYSGLDAGSAWFALDTLKRFIWEIESRVCKKECPEGLKLGVRIYYAKYPNLPPPTGSRWYDDLNGVPPTFGLMHTGFMVPTFDQASRTVLGQTDHIDFDLNSSDCPSAIDTVTTTAVVGLIGGRNHGTLCPPICEGSAF